jgi:hypothetical protein
MPGSCLPLVSGSKLETFRFVFASFASAAEEKKDCGMVAPGTTFDENCKLVPVPPPSGPKAVKAKTPPKK